MTKMKFFAAAAILTSLIATPVLAKDMSDGSQTTVMKQQTKKPNARMSDRRGNTDARFDRGYDDSYRGYDNRYSRNDSGFFPVDIAAGIVGGAVNTAGAIATAPFGGPGYANNDGYRNDGYRNNGGYGYRAGYRDTNASITNYPRVGAFGTAPYTNPTDYNNRMSRDDGFFGQTYAQRNGIVCEPGTVYTNLNGIRTLCQ